ncbi:MAG TPA: hypothetical protein VGF43_22625 [Dongiaceae bacterium]|jgi:hypothetical protein
MKPTTEADLWQAHLVVLRQALAMRKPDAVASVRGETSRLEREIEALQARKALAERAAGGEVSSLAEQLTEVIAERLRWISDLAGLIRQRGSTAKDDDIGPLAELTARPAAIDPIDLLQGKGRLNADQVRAAREIRWVYEAITRAGRARISRLSQIDPPTGWREGPLPERAALIHAKRFVPWAERLRANAPTTLDIVLGIVVLGTAIYPIARKHRMGWRTCVARLADGLDQYWQRPGLGRR